MELGEIVVAERPGERQLYAEQKPRAQELLGRSRNRIHQVFEYLTGEMKEYGEWMKSERRGCAWGSLARRSELGTSVLPTVLSVLGHEKRGHFIPEAEQRWHGPSSLQTSSLFTQIILPSGRGSHSVLLPLPWLQA